MATCIWCDGKMVRKADDRGYKQFQCENCGFTTLIPLKNNEE